MRKAEERLHTHIAKCEMEKQPCPHKAAPWVSFADSGWARGHWDILPPARTPTPQAALRPPSCFSYCLVVKGPQQTNKFGKYEKAIKPWCSVHSRPDECGRKGTLRVLSLGLVGVVMGGNKGSGAPTPPSSRWWVRKGPVPCPQQWVWPPSQASKRNLDQSRRLFCEKPYPSPS